jgi:hypothetical protein
MHCASLNAELAEPVALLGLLVEPQPASATAHPATENAIETFRAGSFLIVNGRGSTPRRISAM